MRGRGVRDKVVPTLNAFIQPQNASAAARARRSLKKKSRDTAHGGRNSQPARCSDISLSCYDTVDTGPSPTTRAPRISLAALCRARNCVHHPAAASDACFYKKIILGKGHATRVLELTIVRTACRRLRFAATRRLNGSQTRSTRARFPAADGWLPSLTRTRRLELGPRYRGSAATLVTIGEKICSENLGLESSRSPSNFQRVDQGAEPLVWSPLGPAILPINTTATRTQTAAQNRPRNRRPDSSITSLV